MEPTHLSVFDGVETTETPGQRIHAVAHAFRLQFYGLGKQRKLDPASFDTVAQGLDTSADSIGLYKLLYDSKCPPVHALNTRKSQAKSTFYAATLPFPELSVRLLPVHSDVLMEQHEEIRRFCTDVRNKLTEYEAAKDYLVAHWDEVLEHNKTKLKALYREQEYPTADDVAATISVTFEPYNFELPAYLRFVDPAEYRRQVQQLNVKFEQAAQLHARTVSQAISDGLEQMLKSLRGYHDGKQRCFTNSVIKNVFEALHKFKECQQKYGLLQSGPIASLFDELHQVMHTGQMDEESLPKVLRGDDSGSADRRAELIAQTSTIMESISQMMELRPRRHIIRDTAPVATELAA